VLNKSIALDNQGKIKNNIVMEVITFSNCEDFLNINEKLLLKNESFHNLILGIAYNIRDKKIEATEPLFFTIKNKDIVVACALRSNSEKPLALTEMSNEAIDQLVKTLLDSEVDLSGVIGEESTADYFKNQWTKIKKLNFETHIHLGVYECFKVKWPNVVLGQLILAKEGHYDILKKWVIGFYQDCFPQNPINEKEIEALMNRHLNNRVVYFLEDENNVIVSMAGNIRSTLNSGTVSLVYSPPEFRGKGFACSVVALLSDKIIKDGKKCANLFTDLTNPTSNSIYQKIGFIKIGQNIHYNFIKIGTKIE
jgi:RimJ/RimL family protein N-acetyltransferase